MLNLDFFFKNKLSIRYHFISIILSMIAVSIGLYLIYYQIDFPVYVVIFVVLILLNTNIAMYYAQLNE